MYVQGWLVGVVGLSPPHLQNGLTRIDSYLTLSLAWIYQRADFKRNWVCWMKHSVGHFFHEHRTCFSPHFHLFEDLHFVLLALAKLAVYVFLYLSLHVHLCGSRGHSCIDPSAFPGIILLWHTKHSVLHADHCCCCEFVNGPRPSFSRKEEKRVPFFSSPLWWVTLLSQPLLLHPKKLNSRSEEIWSSSPTSYPRCCSLRWGIALPSWDTPFALY